MPAETALQSDRRSRDRRIATNCQNQALSSALKMRAFRVIKKACTGCGTEKSLVDFSVQKRGLHGRRSRCKECVSKYNHGYSKARWESDMQFREKTIRSAAEWAAKNPDRRAEIAKARNTKERASSPEKVSARALVNQRVRFGRMPKASSLPCSQCAAPAAHYHHHKGYAFPDRYNVVPVCAACHKMLG